MKEGYFSHSAMSEMEEKEERGKRRKNKIYFDSTGKRPGEPLEEPLDVGGHFLSLRGDIQEVVGAKDQKMEGQQVEARIKLLKELISPELLVEYNQILSEFRKKNRVTKENPKRGHIDLDGNKGLSDLASQWISHLLAEVKIKKVYLDEAGCQELEAQCWMFFDAVANVVNADSLEKDIKGFYKDHNPSDFSEKENKKFAKELDADLKTRYPLSEVEIKAMVDFVTAEYRDYNPQVLWGTIMQIWQEYGTKGKTGRKVAKLSGGFFMTRLLESYATSLFENIFSGDKFNVAVFLEYFGLNKVAEVINAKIQVELLKVMNEFSAKINERITDSLFFHNFEFIHDKEFGEIFTALENGKTSAIEIIKDTIAEVAPMLSGIAMSLGFLTTIHWGLGAISAASLPVMYSIAKKQSRRTWSVYQQGKSSEEKIANQFSSIQAGYEEIKTSAGVPDVAQKVKKQFSAKDTLTMRLRAESVMMNLKRMIPFDVSTVVSAGVGGVMQETGMISGGAILSNVQYSGALNRDIESLVDIYFNRFAHYVRDIKRMNEILGEYEKVDLPEGEKEKNRVPISRLENFDLEVDGLHYKDILRGVSFTVKEGEFLVITGTSGAGKSTLLRNMAGLYQPDAGAVKIGGINMEHVKKYGPESIYAAMSYCNQRPQIFSEMNLRDNLLLWTHKKVDDSKIKEVLRDLKLDKFVDKLDEQVGDLSAGELVRVGVARVLLKEPKIMLLDEPTSNLDSQSANEVREVIARVRAKKPNTTIICVSHDEDMAALGSRVLELAGNKKKKN